MGAPAFTDSLSKWGRDDTIHENVRVSLSHQSRADEIRFGTSLESVAIPEPGTLALLGGALASLLYLRRRRR